MRKAHRSTLRKLNRRSDLPCVGFEMDWVFFCANYPGRWRWGNPRTLWGVQTRQEIRAAVDEKEQREDFPNRAQRDEDWEMEWRM